MRRCPALFCALIAALLLGGCGAEPERPAEPTAERDSSVAEATPPADPFAEPARRALRIELGLDSYQTVEGTWAAGDAASTFTAHFAGDTLRLIEERSETDTYAAGTTAYYFEDGALFYAVRDAWRRLGPNASEADTLQTRAAFGPDGGLLTTQQVVGDTVGPAPAAEVDALREHAHTLRDRALVLRRNGATPEV